MNRRAMPRTPSLLLSLIFLLAACGQQTSAPVEQPPLAGAQLGGPFTLTDSKGATVTDKSWPGKFLVVYFGYTYCPDACPADVSVLMRGFRQFEQDHAPQVAKVQPLFITIDPERDTPARVGEFAAAFHPRLIGLTGTPQQIAAVAKSYAAYYAKAPDTKPGAKDYLMDHSRVAYLMSPHGKPIAMLPIDQGPAAVAAELGKWVH